MPANTSLYQPITLPCGCLLLLLQAGAAAGSVVLHVESTSGDAGEAELLDLKEGAVVFTAARQKIFITTGAEGATFYRAHVNLTDQEM